MRKMIVGSRKSRLALTQTKWVIQKLQQKDPNRKMELKTITTKGDRILDVTLSKVGGKGLFVKEIENALLEKRIDFAVHSLKDLPAKNPEGLVIAAIPKRETPFDCLISRNGESLDQLPANAVIGTSSLRRQGQVLAYRSDLKVKPIRGNIDTRLKRLKQGEFDGILLAVAGLARMDWEDHITQELPLSLMIPAVGQGALAIQCREEDQEMIDLLRSIHHEETARCVCAERAFLFSFQGNCHLPIACYAKKEGNAIYLTGLVSSPDGKKVIRKSLVGKNEEQLGQTLADQMISLGAKDLFTV